MAGISLHGILDSASSLTSWIWRLDERADRQLNGFTKYLDAWSGQMDRVCVATCDKLENRCEELERKIDDFGDVGRVEGKIDDLESGLESQVSDIESDSESKVDDLEPNLEDKIRDLESNLESKMDDFESGVGRRVEELENDLDKRCHKMVDSFETWEKELDLHFEEHTTLNRQRVVQPALATGQASVQAQ